MSEVANQGSPLVFIVDDDEIARTFVRQMLQEAGIAAETFDSADEFLARADLSRANCVVTDVHMDGMTGVELQERLAHACAALPVIVVTGFATASLAVQAMRHRAAAFLEKPFHAEQLIEAVRAALEQNQAERERLARKALLDERFAALQTGDLEILEKLAAGLGNKEIAHALDVSLRTVEARRQRIFAALHVDSAAAAVSLHLEFQRL